MDINEWKAKGGEGMGGNGKNGRERGKEMVDDVFWTRLIVMFIFNDIYHTPGSTALVAGPSTDYK